MASILPTSKQVGADVLFRDESRRVLLVDPSYKPGWDLPGGMVEANESPLEGVIREVREELGIEYAGGGLLAVDWKWPRVVVALDRLTGQGPAYLHDGLAPPPQ